jgi:dihydrofolate reductase
MGKNTYLSLPEENKPLKNRLNIVLTNNPLSFITNDKDTKNNNLIFTNDINIYNLILKDREKYITLYPSLSTNFKIYIIGGQQIYQQYIPLCEIIWVTQIKQNYSCDLIFDYDYKKQFKEEIYEEDEELKFIKYEKII